MNPPHPQKKNEIGPGPSNPGPSPFELYSQARQPIGRQIRRLLSPRLSHKCLNPDSCHVLGVERRRKKVAILLEKRRLRINLLPLKSRFGFSQTFRWLQSLQIFKASGLAAGISRDSGSSSEVERAPHDHEVVGLNPAGCWAFFSFYCFSDVSFKGSLKEVHHFWLSLPKNAQLCCLGKTGSNKHRFEFKKSRISRLRLTIASRPISRL